MSQKFLYDSHDGIEEIVHFDDSQDAIHLETRQDVEAILDRNARLRSTGDNDRATSGGMKFVASIPIAVLSLWENLYGVADILSADNADLFKRLLNDPDWRKLRIWGGQV